MRWVLVFLFTLFNVGCSQVDVTNSSVIDQLEERLEFDKTEGADAVSRSVEFIRELNKRESKSTFLVQYKPNSSEFVAKLRDRFKSIGISKDRYKIELAKDGQGKNIFIIGRYVRIQSSDCGVITFSHRDEYQFGCSVEHNRNISLVNPIKKAQ